MFGIGRSRELPQVPLALARLEALSGKLNCIPVQGNSSFPENSFKYFTGTLCFCFFINPKLRSQSTSTYSYAGATCPLFPIYLCIVGFTATLSKWRNCMLMYSTDMYGTYQRMFITKKQEKKQARKQIIKRLSLLNNTR